MKRRPGTRRSGADVAALDDAAAKNVGELLRASGTTDLVDAHVALLVQVEGTVLTRDDADIEALLRTRKVDAAVVHVERGARRAVP